MHPVASYGLRISVDGFTLGYSGDTGPCPGLDVVARDVDLLLAEASFRSGDDNPPDLHLTGRDCGEAAARAGARRLLLTHVPPWFDREHAAAEARAVYDGPVDIARPGETYRC